MVETASSISGLLFQPDGFFRAELMTAEARYALSVVDLGHSPVGRYAVPRAAGYAHSAEGAAPLDRYWLSDEPAAEQTIDYPGKVPLPRNSALELRLWNGVILAAQDCDV